MMIGVTIDPGLESKFPGLKVLTGCVEGVKVESGPSRELLFLKGEVASEVRAKYSLETLKDQPIFRFYRDWFWRVGIDPTKIRPAAEALIRRILAGKPIPSINSLVDAYNLASIRTEIALAAFDLEKLKGRLLMRYAKGGEVFLGIGMEKPLNLKGNEIVLLDEMKIVAIYPYRDSDETKVIVDTEGVLLLACGVPGISVEVLKRAMDLATNYVQKFCDGRISES